MASAVVITYGELSVTVQVADSYPDSLRQACAEAVRGFREALAVAGEDEGDED